MMVSTNTVADQPVDIIPLPPPSRLFHMLEILALVFLLLTLLVTVGAGAPLVVTLAVALFLVIDLLLLFRMAKGKQTAKPSKEVLNPPMTSQQRNTYYKIAGADILAFVLTILSWFIAGVHSIEVLISSAIMVFLFIILILYNLLVTLQNIKSTGQKIANILYRLGFIAVLIAGVFFVYLAFFHFHSG